MGSRESLLEGVPVGYSSPNITAEIPGPEAWAAITAMEVTASIAEQSLGAIVLRSPDKIPEAKYRLNPRPDTQPELYVVKERLYASFPDVAIPSMPAKNCNKEALLELAGGKGLVLANFLVNGGYGKYAIDDERQLDRALDFFDSHPEHANAFEFRLGIETSSNNYTSYRTLVTAGGQLIGFALLVSRHKQNNDLRIVTTDLPDVTDESGISWRFAFENPESEYFLNSRDVRSNAGQGALVVPLMSGGIMAGHYKERIANNRRNPAYPKLTNDAIRKMIQVSQHTGRVEGPMLDLVLGIDFIVDREGKVYLVEVNMDPGSLAFAHCIAGGDMPMDVGQIVMRNVGLGDIAYGHNIETEEEMLEKYLN